MVTAYVARKKGLTVLPGFARAAGAGGLPAWLLPAAVLAAVPLLLVAAVAAWGGIRHALARHGAADLATAAAAAMASTLSATGMWVFFSSFVPLAAPLRAVVFAFLEISTIAVALRARDNMREFGASGVDGLLMWTFTGGSALLASTAANSPPETLLRLGVPLVAALLWERVLVTERRRWERAKGNLASAGSWWRRMQARAGLADPMARSAGEAERDRLLTAVALAVHRFNQVTSRHPDSWRARQAEGKMNAAMQAAMERTELATSAQLQQALTVQVRMLGSAQELARLGSEFPWDWREAAPGTRQDASGPGETGELAGELTSALRDGDYARLGELLDGRGDIAELARWVVTTGAPKRLLAAIGLHAGPEELASVTATAQWIAEVTGQSQYLPDKSEIRRIRSQLFPRLASTGSMPPARTLENAA